jgi:hypothetical protein
LGAAVRALASTRYFDHSGAAIGQLDSDFRGSPYAPAYVFEDRRGGEAERARAEGLLRLLAPRLEVDYDLATHRLLRYSGLSNLEGPAGKSEQVVIRYRYGAES